MKLTMTEGSEKYGAPTGLYRAKFLGAKQDTHPEFGPGLKWEFEISEGPSAGKIISRTTSPTPTLKNGCGKMLQMITGGVAALHQELDLDAYVGQVFQVMVENNSTGTGTRVGSVMPTTAPTQQRPAAPAPPPRPAPPPPAASSAQQPAAPTWFWVQTPQMAAPERMVREKLQSLLDTAKTPEEAAAIAVMADDQLGGWKTCADFGVTKDIPF